MSPLRPTERSERQWNPERAVPGDGDIPGWNSSGAAETPGRASTDSSDPTTGKAKEETI